MSIAETLREISEESCLALAETDSLRLIAEEVETLEAHNAHLQKAVKEWRAKADSELAINAELHTETAQLKAENKQLWMAIEFTTVEYDKAMSFEENAMYSQIAWAMTRLCTLVEEQQALKGE